MDDGKVRRWLECRGSDWITGRNVGKLWEQHVAQMIRNRLLGYKVIKAGTLMCSAQSVLGLLNMLLNWAVLDTEKGGGWPWMAGSVQAMGSATEVELYPCEGTGCDVLGDDHLQPCTPYASTANLKIMTQPFVTHAQLTTSLFQLPYWTHSYSDSFCT